MKQFTEFRLDDTKYKLEVYCYALEAGEVEGLIKSLEDRGFKLTFIDSDSIRGELQLELYPQIVQIRKQLEEEGFTWSEKAESTKDFRLKE